MSNFFILGLPRSRTAWLANFMTYGDTFCYHEALAGCRSIEDYKVKLGNNRGDSCTYLSLIDIEKHFPKAKIVIIQREPTRAINFAHEEFGMDVHSLIFDHMAKARKLTGMRVRFEDIDDSLQDIWEYITDEPYNKERGDMLKKLNIQVKDPHDFDMLSAQELAKEFS